MSHETAPSRRHVETDPCGPGECPCEAAGYPCPSTSGIHRHPVAGFCAKQKRDAAFRAQLVEMARSDHEGGTPSAASAKLPCRHMILKGACGESWLNCRLGKGTQGLVDESHCRSCIAAGDNRPIRVGIVSTIFGYGGTERWAGQVIRATAREGIEWVGIAVTAGEGCVNRDAVRGFGVAVPVLAGPDSVRELTSACDVVILWAKHANERAEPLEELACGTIMVAHGDGPYTRDSVSRAAACDVLAAVSDSAVPPFPEGERHRVRVIYNAIEPTSIPAGDRQAYRDAARRCWGIADDRPVVGFLARTSFEKGPDLFLDAVAALPPEWLGVMVGPYQDHARHELESRGVAGRVLLAGETSHTHAALLGFDCLLVPSREEGFCYAATEAIDLEIPVVMTPVGFAASRPDLVTGVPIEASGPVMADAILRAAGRDRGELATLRDAAREAFDFAGFGVAWREAIVGAARARREKGKAKP